MVSTCLILPCILLQRSATFPRPSFSIALLFCLIRLLQHLTGRRRHPSARLRRILTLEIITHLLKGDPLDALMAVDVVDDALMHQQYVWVTGDIGMDGHGENELVIIGVEVVEVILFSAVSSGLQNQG